MNKYQTWQWRGFNIGYQSCGEIGTAVVFVHGFGANSGHWRKNISVLGKDYRCYAIDLIGFGKSSKPTPGKPLDYTFETWAKQVADFCQEVVKTPVFLVDQDIEITLNRLGFMARSDDVNGGGLSRLSFRNCLLKLFSEITSRKKTSNSTLV